MVDSNKEVSNIPSPVARIYNGRRECLTIDTGLTAL